MTFQLHTLKKRADFLRARSGRYFAANGLVIQSSKMQIDQHLDDPIAEPQNSDSKNVENLSVLHQPRFGFTATKKLGNAVVRNRIKRRLRDAVRLIAPQKARPGYEYVLIGRKSTLKRPFSALLRDLTIAFDRVHGKRVTSKRHSDKKAVGKNAHSNRGNNRK